MQTTVASAGADYTTGSAEHTIYLFETTVAVDPDKTVEAVTLPSLGNVAGKDPALRILAMTLGTPTSLRQAQALSYSAWLIFPRN